MKDECPSCRLANVLFGRSGEDPFDVKQDIEKLKADYQLYSKTTQFQPGDIVEWKPGLRNRDVLGPFVVIRWVDEPLNDTSHPTSSCYYGEPLDIVIGQHNKDGDFQFWHVDPQRLQLYKPE